MAEPGTDLLTMAEAARELHISRVTIARWVKDGRLASFRVGPRAIRIRRADLQTVVKPHATNGASDPTEIASQPPAFRFRPLSEEEVAQGYAALRASQEHMAKVRAERGNIPFSESWPLIREARGDEEPA